MRKLRMLPSMAGLICVLAVPSVSEAMPMDLEIWRLGNPSTITLSDGTQRPAFADANDRFRLLMVDVGMAMHPTPSHPADTLGRAGTSFEVGLRLPQIHPGARVHPGEGVLDDPCPPGNPTCMIWVTRGTAEGYLPRTLPPDRLIVPTLQVRKGLPFSLEMSTKMQYLVNSSTLGMTGGLRWALNEGFDFLPDLSVGGQVTRLIGTKDFGIASFSADVLLGKWFPIAGSATMGPYLGWQRVWIHAVSSTIDFDPGRENEADPIADDKRFEPLSPFENMFDRVVFGLRLRSYVTQLLLEGSYQPPYLGMDEAINITVMMGLDF